MTVKELIELLQQFEESAEVMVEDSEFDEAYISEVYEQHGKVYIG